MNRLMANFLWLFGNIILLTIGIAFSDIEKFYFVLAIIGGFQLLLAIYVDVRNEKSLFNPLVIYEVVMYLFLFGQCLMWIITEDYGERNIIDIYDMDLIEKAEIFTLLSMFFFHIALFSTRNRMLKTVNHRRTVRLKAAMYLCGKLLLCVTIIPEIVYNIRIFTIAQSMGYGGIYTNQASGILLTFLNLREFFFPAVILILCGDIKNNNILRNSLVIIIVLDSFVSLYVGSRSDAMMQILSLSLILQVIKTNKIKTSKITIVKFSFLFIALIMIANIVQVIRIIPNRDITTFFEYMFSSKGLSENIIVGIMGELGGSMSTLIETMILVPSNYEYLYGSSYIYAITWIMPNFITNGIWKKASMDNWIDTVRYTGSGWGFSTTAEAYFNFSYAGVFVFIIIGFVVGKLFKGINRDLFENNPVEFALSFILFNRLLIFSRIDFLSALPTIVYFYFCLKILIYVIEYLNRVKGG